MNLIELVETGDIAGVLEELGALTPDQRASRAADLAARREAMDRMDRYTWGCLDNNVKDAWWAVELAGRTTPESAAAWLMEPSYLWGMSCGPMVAAVYLYPAEWRVELVARLGEATHGWTGGWFALAEHIIRDTGCTLPTSDTFIQCWLRDRIQARKRAPGVLGGSRGATPAERLRNDDFAGALLQLAVQRPGVGIRHSREVFIELAAEGVIDREMLGNRTAVDLLQGDPAQADAVKALEGRPLTSTEQDRLATARRQAAEPSIARLLQDGAVKWLKQHFANLRDLALTPAENAVFLRDHVAMLDLSSPVAGYGQEVLTGLDGAGLLEPDVLTEACERILLRPEKKLVRAQLSWLDRVARRRPARAGRVAIDAATALQHADVALQERALDLIARHLQAAGGEVLPQLQTAAAGISPGLAARAAELLGLPQGGETGRYTEILPAAPEPQPVPGPVASVAEAAQEVAVALADRDDVAAFERALDGLVRHARLDREALSDALKPLVRKKPRRPSHDRKHDDIYDVAVEVCGSERRRLHINLPKSRLNLAISRAGMMLQERLREAIEVIEADSQPFLLALPTLSTGAIDAAVLVERIAEFEELGITPAPIDLAQALLRVDPAPDEPVLRAAEKLGSDAGQRLAQWLRAGGLEHQDSTPPGWPHRLRRESDPACPGPATELRLPPIAAALVGPRETEDTQFRYPGPRWTAQLPHHRDEVAARLPRRSDFEDAHEREKPVAAFLVEAGGPAGFAVHWKVAYDLNEVAEPLLVLAAQGQLDCRLLGEQVALLVGVRGGLRANRAAATLRTAAETGAYATVWSVLAAALPGMLRGTPDRGAGAFLALAVECASRCGATGPIPEVDAVAGRKGSTQTIKNARLLRDVLR
ncbi:DUF6493 family protein [Streptomonospora sediminis]